MNFFKIIKDFFAVSCKRINSAQVNTPTPALTLETEDGKVIYHEKNVIIQKLTLQKLETSETSETSETHPVSYECICYRNDDEFLTMPMSVGQTRYNSIPYFVDWIKDDTISGLEHKILNVTEYEQENQKFIFIEDDKKNIFSLICYSSNILLLINVIKI